MRTGMLRLLAAALPFAYVFQAPATNCTVFIDPIRILRGWLYFSNCDVEYDDGRIEEIDCDD